MLHFVEVCVARCASQIRDGVAYFDRGADLPNRVVYLVRKYVSTYVLGSTHPYFRLGTYYLVTYPLPRGGPVRYDWVLLVSLGILHVT